MTRLIWTKTAVRHLRMVRELKHRRRIYSALQGLRSLPRAGRIPPEIQRSSSINVHPELRELVFPDLVRVFYRYDAEQDLIYVLAMSFRGQNVTAKWIREQ